MLQKRSVAIVGCLLVAGLASAPLHAAVVPDRSSSVGQKEYRHPDLTIPNEVQRADTTRFGGGNLAGGAAALGSAPGHSYLDARSGRWAIERLAP